MMNNENDSLDSGNQSALRLLRMFVGGVGMRPDRTGSGYAVINEDTKKARVRVTDGLSKTEAEYWAILSVLETVPEGAQVEIGCTSPLVCAQFDGRCGARLGLKTRRPSG